MEHKFRGFEEAARPKLGMALIFDIAGFSRFFNKPDLQLYITNYINHIIECVETPIYGGLEYWNEDPEVIPALSFTPCSRKFLGDGMLYIWEDDDYNIITDADFKLELINKLWSIQSNFNRIITNLYNDMPVGDLPTKIKFGMAQGTIYKLKAHDGSLDYIGPCINLASRLVKYCPEIDFICSTRINLPKEKIISAGYIKLIAKELKSFEEEIVIVNSGDYAKIKKNDKMRLFRAIDV